MELPREFRRQFGATGEFEGYGEGAESAQEEETDFVCTTFPEEFRGSVQMVWLQSEL